MSDLSELFNQLAGPEPFGVWLAHRIGKDTSIGDLARDVAADVATGCATTPDTPEALWGHAQLHHWPSDEVRATLARARRAWKATR